MKSITLLSTLVAGLCCSAHGALTFTGTGGGALLQDGDLALDPSKQWTLFIADRSTDVGSTPSTLNSWSVAVTTVTAGPEPPIWLGGLGALAMLGSVFVRRRVA